MAEATTALTRLRVVCSVHEDEAGATLQFQDGGCGRLPRQDDPAYAAHLRLARRSQERQQPLGISIGTGDVITGMARADNDVPLQIVQQAVGASRVLFQGHDGVFRLQSDHADAARIGAVLAESMRAGTPVWFVADKPDLTLLDASPVFTECTSPNGATAGSGNGKGREE